LMIPCLETQMNAKVHHYGEKCNVNIFHQTLPNVVVVDGEFQGSYARCAKGSAWVASKQPHGCCLILQIFDTKQQPTTCSSWNTYQCNIIWQFLKINVFMHAPPHQMPKHVAPFQSRSLFSNLHPLAVQDSDPEQSNFSSPCTFRIRAGGNLET
jgi:hypothetical protein